MQSNGKPTPTTHQSDRKTARLAVEGSPGPTVWEHTLGREISEARAGCLRGLMRIPTGLGRLAYLAILQQQLLEDHEELFGDWHCCSLQQKHDWLYRLLVSASQSGTLPDEWLAASTYADLVPRSAQEGDRNTYRGDIEAILDMLKDERSAFCGEEKEEKGESPAQQLGALSNFSPCVSK